MDHVTAILDQLESGNRSAADQLFALVYDELRQMAAARMEGERAGQTLQPTALVHEVFLRLVGTDRRQEWKSTRHFFAVAADVMRHVLVDAARRRGRIRRGGDRHRLEFHPELVQAGHDTVDIEALDEALQELARLDPVKSRLVVLRFFGGLSVEEACEVLEISRTTAHRYWEFSRAWLYRKLQSGETRSTDSAPGEDSAAL